MTRTQSNQGVLYYLVVSLRCSSPRARLRRSPTTPSLSQGLKRSANVTRLSYFPLCAHSSTYVHSLHWPGACDVILPTLPSQESRHVCVLICVHGRSTQSQCAHTPHTAARAALTLLAAVHGGYRRQVEGRLAVTTQRPHPATSLWVRALRGAMSVHTVTQPCPHTHRWYGHQCSDLHSSKCTPGTHT